MKNSWINLEKLTKVALDIADANTSEEIQAQYAETILFLLEQNYKVYLFSSQKQDLSKEDFQHPRVQFLAKPPPPLKADMENCLWVTNNTNLVAWLDEHNHMLVRIGGGEGGSLSAISNLRIALNPITHKIGDVVRRVKKVRKQFPQRAIVVGVGGTADLELAATAMKNALQDAEFPLVETLNVSSITPAVDANKIVDSQTTITWQDPKAGQWLIKKVLEPLQHGKTLLIQTREPAMPAEIDLPIYLHTGTVLLIYAEMLFVKPIQLLLDAHLLLELPLAEQTRRAYEIKPDKPFEPKFIEQFLKTDGAQYQNYLKQHQVEFFNA